MSSSANDHMPARTRSSRVELLERMETLLPADGPLDPSDGLRLFRASSPTDLNHTVLAPSFCLIAQGSKQILAGDRSYRYDPYHYLLGTVELPIITRVVEATPDRPYLSVRLILDPALVSSVMVEAGYSSPKGAGNVSAFDVSPLGPELLDAVLRLVRLLDEPGGEPVLSPLIRREIVYRLLTGAQGARLAHVAVLGGHGHRIARAVKMIRERFNQAIPVRMLAEELGMSVSSFHNHFKSVTGMTPLRFQKQLQLQEARRLMLSENVDAATAGYRVGYNDPSHFSREYKRHFGESPIRDAERLRQNTSQP